MKTAEIPDEFREPREDDALPGAQPFDVSVAEDWWICGRHLGAVAVIDANCMEICRVRTFGGIVETFADAEKMARLFARAPSLDAACRRMLRLAQSQISYPSDYVEWKTVANFLRRAVGETRTP